MCEVNSCCCLSLRQGCVLIGGVTILVSFVQTLIFSWVLIETYQSHQSSLKYQTSISTNSSMTESSSSTYSFDSSRCPLGFLPLSPKIHNESTEEEYEEETNLTQEEVVTSLVTTTTTVTSTSTSSNDDSSSQGQSLNLELPLDEENRTSSAVSSSSKSATLEGSSSQEVADVNVDGDARNSSSLSSAASLQPSHSSSTNNSFVPIAASSPVSSSSSFSSNTLYANSSTYRTLNKTNMKRIRCAAPGQGLLWALVVASALYLLVGVLLIFAIIYCVSWQLSIWFFYTVGYNLFLLIVAMTDGTYTSLSDISSYVVCVITTYCVIVVDSYYEKQLLHDERMDKNGAGRRRSSLVIVRSSPDTPTSTQPDYIPPTSYRVPVNPSNNLAPPPAHNLAPPTVKFANPLNLAPPPTRPPSYHNASERNREYPHHAYHNNL